ncbi:MAG TPA: DMT family transporter [Methanomassiliicoccales archaeon]|nr:DMT family transporter [Methanomassiliicoccales archaeon]
MDAQRGAYPALAIAILAVSFASIFVRWSDSHPLVLAGYRMLFAALLLAPFALRERRKAEPLDRRTMAGVLGTGVVLAIHFFAFISSLRHTSVASSTLLVNCHPLIVGAASVLLLRESSRRTVLGVAVGLIGVAALALSSVGTGEEVGNALALLGGAMAAIYLLAGRVLRRRLGTPSYAFLVYMAAALVLLAAAFASGVPLHPYPAEEVLLFLALAVVCTIFGHTVYNWALGYLPAPVVSTALLGEPVLASMLALVLLGEAPGPAVLLAAPLVLAGVLLTASDRTGREGKDGRPEEKGPP